MESLSTLTADMEGTVDSAPDFSAGHLTPLLLRFLCADCMSIFGWENRT